MQRSFWKLLKEKAWIILVPIIVIMCGGIILGIISHSDYLSRIVLRWLGFPGVSDFAFDVAEGHQLVRTSANIVEVVPKGVRTIGKTPYIPYKVVKLAWNERFVIAQQDALVPDQPLNYWILDVTIPNVYGPFDKTEFERQRSIVGVPDTLVLKPISSYRK